MKTIAIFIIAAILLPGCVTRERCLKRFPPIVSDSVQVVRETIVITRDTLVYISVPGESKLRIDTVFVDKTGQINSGKSFLETSLAWSMAEVRNGKLLHELHQKDTTIEFRLQNAIREVDRLEKELRQKTTTVEVPRQLSSWQKFALTWTNISLGAVLMALIFLAIKLRSKLL